MVDNFDNNYVIFVKQLQMLSLFNKEISLISDVEKVTFIERKENRVVKNNQVAERIEYTLEVNYDLFYKSNKCKIFNKTIISKFAFTPKSAGYNFGSDRSFDKLYNSSVDQNINNFIDALLINKSCIK